MNASEIEKAIEVLKSCQYCWADQIADDGQKISDYKAIEQSIKCLESWMHKE